MATSLTWTGSSSDNWSDANNWNPKQIPVNGDTVTVGGNPYIGTTAVAQTLTINSGGEIDVSGSKAAATGSLVIGTGIANSGKLMLEGGPFDATLEFAPSTQFGGVQLSGSGTVTMSDSTHNSITTGALGATLTNSNTISGAGQFGDGSGLALINNGLINATGTNNQLVMLMSQTATNNATIESTGAAGLNIQSTINSSGGGVINANGGNVFLSDGTLIGGTLLTSSGGVIETEGNANTINAVTNVGSVHVNDGTSLTVAGAIANNGIIQMLSAGDQTYLAAAATGTTLGGTGTVLLTDNAHNVITGSGTGSTLNIVLNIITGAGIIGGNGLTVNNAGAIVAIGVNNPLIVETGGTLTNNGLLSATGPAGLQIVGTTVNSSGGGQITANAPGAVVQLNDTHLMGGTLRTAGSGAQIQAIGQSSILDGTITTLGNTGTVVIAGSGTQLQIIGSISNSGAFTISSGGGLVIGTQNATLSGGGAVTLNASSANSITGEGASTFNNQNNTISGSGSFVDMMLTNGGTIDADNASVPLILRTSHTIANNGLLEAVTGTLTASDNVIGTGTALIAAGGTMSFGGGFQENLAFSGAGALVVSQAYGGTIFGFGSGDTVDLANLVYKSSYVPVWQSNGTLAIEDAANGNAIVATVAFSGNYLSGSFALSNNNNTTLISGTGALAPNPPPPAGTSANMILRDGSGNFEIYNTGSNAILAAGPLGQVGLAWQVVGFGDFSGNPDEFDDMLMRNATTGQFEVYDISNNAITTAAAMGQVGLEWQVAGFGDFSGNANETDMLMRNTGTGAFEIYDISNNAINNAAPMGQVGLEWSVAGFGDFSTRPNETDMLMRNRNTGAFEIYDISNNQLTSAAPMGQVGLEWSVAGFGDFSGNANETDMLMRNNNTGAFEIYDISNSQLTSAAPMGAVGLEWSVVGFGSINGAGSSDMLMRNTNTGAFEIYDITNNQLTTAAPMGAVGLDWQVAGIASNSVGTANAQLTQAMASYASAGGTLPAAVTSDQTPQPTATSFIAAAQSSPNPS
jgi:hypothetical protein